MVLSANYKSYHPFSCHHLNQGGDALCSFNNSNSLQPSHNAQRGCDEAGCDMKLCVCKNEKSARLIQFSICGDGGTRPNRYKLYGNVLPVQPKIPHYVRLAYANCPEDSKSALSSQIWRLDGSLVAHRPKMFGKLTVFPPWMTAELKTHLGVLWRLNLLFLTALVFFHSVHRRKEGGKVVWRLQPVVSV